MSRNKYKHPISVPIFYKGYTITYNYMAILWVINKNGAHIAMSTSEDMAKHTIDKLTEPVK